MTRLLIIYGSEASGKLTIAKEVAKLTDLKLFHNHISIDVGKVLYEYGEQRFSDLVWQVRLAVFKSAARENLPGIVFTWAYSHPDMYPLLDQLLKAIQTYEVEVHYVHISCSQDALEQRVVSEDRKAADKACTIEALHRIQRVKNHQPIPDSNSFLVDSTDLPATDAARMIIDKFGLPTGELSESK